MFVRVGNGEREDREGRGMRKGLLEPRPERLGGSIPASPLFSLRGPLFFFEVVFEKFTQDTQARGGVAP